MKKIIMLLTAIAMLATSVIGVSAVDYTADNEGKYTGVAYSGLTANEYYGVVVVNGIDAAVDFENTENILYIDQVTADADGNITIPAFMTKGDTLVEGTVYIGGEGLGTATCIGYLKLAANDEKFVISGTVSSYAGTVLPTVKVTDGTNEYTATVNADKTFSVEVPALASGAYTLIATKTSHLSYTKSNITAETTAVQAKVFSGDIDKSGQADVLDIGEIINVFNSKSGDDDYSIAIDLDESGQCDVLDIGEIINNFNKQNITE